MAPPWSYDKPTATDDENHNLWKFTWEAQSHASIIRLVLFNPDTNPRAQCRDLKVSLILQESLIMASFVECGSEEETLLRVQIPRTLIDPESPPNFRAFDDHIEVKLVLLLPVDHALVSDFDSILNVDEKREERPPHSVDSDLKKLSCIKEVHLYCRNCSSKLTKCIRVKGVLQCCSFVMFPTACYTTGRYMVYYSFYWFCYAQADPTVPIFNYIYRCFSEMPSVNWRDVADNWFGNCCCSFGGVSEKLVASYAQSYMCAPGLGLLSISSVLLCKTDLSGCENQDERLERNKESVLSSVKDAHSTGISHDEASMQVPTICGGKGNEDMLVLDRSAKSFYSENNSAANVEYESLGNVVNGDSLSCTVLAEHVDESKILMNEIRETGHCGNECCTQIAGADTKFLENQRALLDGYLGNGFMIRSSGITKDIHWTESVCRQCSSPIGAYPCYDDNAAIDGGVRLFKCNISTCLPCGGSEDAFGSYTLERIFASQLLENARDELSFRTIVRDIRTKSPLLHIVLLNPNSWGCTGNLEVAETDSNLAMHPIIKVLYSAPGKGMKFDSRTMDDWARKGQADEIYMFSSQIGELIHVLEQANQVYPLSCASLQGLLLSSMRR